MRKLLLLAGAAALIGTVPAIAKPGHGNAGAKAHAAHVTKGKAMKAKATNRVLTRALDRNRNGIRDADEALARRYGGALCPPGLWKKTPSCMPPGQAKRLFREGQRLSNNYRYYTPYANIPLTLREQYDLDPNFRYIYRNNVIYTVDPTTRIVTDIINAVL